MHGCGSPAGILDSVPSPLTYVAGTPGVVVLSYGVGSIKSPAGGGLRVAPEGCSGTLGPAGSVVLQQAVPRREGDEGLETLNGFVTVMKFHIETVASVLGSMPQGTGCSPST